MEMKMKTLKNEICGKLTYEKFKEYASVGLYNETNKERVELFNKIYEVERDILSYPEYLERGLILRKNYLKKLNKYKFNNSLIETMNIIMYELKMKSDFLDKYNFLVNRRITGVDMSIYDYKKTKIIP